MIEDKIGLLIAALESNTAAKEANTAALNAVLAKSGGTTPDIKVVHTSTPAPTEAPAKAAPVTKGKKVVITPIDKTSSLVTAVDVEETVVTEPEPEATPGPEPTPAGPVNRDELLLEIKETVTPWLQGLGSKLPKGMEVYTELRTKWGIKVATDLKDEQLVPFIADVKALIATEL